MIRLRWGNLEADINKYFKLKRGGEIKNARFRHNKRYNKRIKNKKRTQTRSVYSKEYSTRIGI